MARNEQLGGIIQTYQRYDAINFPSPTAEPPDMASAAMEHLLAYGNTRRLTEEELANAVMIDPSQIKGLGPSIDALKALLEARKRKILETYEADTVQQEAERNYKKAVDGPRPPERLAKKYNRAVKEESIADLEGLYYASGREGRDFSRQLVPLIETLAQKYQVEQLAADYDFTGRTEMTVPKALEIKEELDTIEKLLKQLEEASKTAQIGLIDMDALAEFVEGQDLEGLRRMQEQINEYIKQEGERQGVEQGRKGYELTPKAFRLFQSKLLTTIFSQMQESRTGRHDLPIEGDGATEMQRTRPYEFGDSVANMDIPSTMINAMLRQGNERPIRLKQDDIEIHATRNRPKAATVVLLDMSGSMRYDGLYVNVKKMGLALDGLIRSEYPGDYCQFIEMATFAKPKTIHEVPELMPKPVTIFDPVVRLRADMADPDITEMQLPHHFTNIQHGLQLSRRYLANQDTPNRQVIIITDGLPTAHFEGSMLHMLYPPHPSTEAATLREAHACAKDGITINIFLLQSWNQSSEDVQFAYKMAQSTKGRVVFTAGRDLDRFVVWDYITMRKSIVS